eukprot:CAMPEP_0202870912 /NCGR_PEP_ID=MMETSP1391-20130828/17188_1 /ASSEMBLY_ACC=CAM_ASM_000867 /TAXON_ID=1034604 /ORGANISM="Chlamydomonas leiostraca, Strain SAG 11-49" /LENGTH=242 /DNA_ID=CAMNT_0049551587 /DNA_START=110 /DNA_END=834 /DNA_ORIENTATION=+
MEPRQAQEKQADSPYGTYTATVKIKKGWQHTGNGQILRAALHVDKGGIPNEVILTAEPEGVPEGLRITLNAFVNAAYATNKLKSVVRVDGMILVKFLEKYSLKAQNASEIKPILMSECTFPTLEAAVSAIPSVNQLELGDAKDLTRCLVLAGGMEVKVWQVLKVEQVEGGRKVTLVNFVETSQRFNAMLMDRDLGKTWLPASNPLAFFMADPELPTKNSLSLERSPASGVTDGAELGGAAPG